LLGNRLTITFGYFCQAKSQHFCGDSSKSN
jgi:hypothetical protein